MNWLDWLVVIIPLGLVLGLGFYSRRYIRGVADFLSAGRVARRYVISVADVAAAFSVVGLVSYIEVTYKTGFAMSFWTAMSVPIGVFIALSGWCTYRFRETKAMSFGQFVEMRYNRPLRVFAAILRSSSEILSNIIMPAIAGRFFIYFLDLPRSFTVCGVTFDTLLVLMALCVILALVIVWWGGALALIVTGAFQGIVFYPVVAILIIFIFSKFSWTQDVLPTLLDRVPGESFIDPFDIEKLRDFNLFQVFSGWVTAIYCRANWVGGGLDSAAISPHEQKMSGLLGTFRNALTVSLSLTIGFTVVALLHSGRFQEEAASIRTAISAKVAEDVVADPALRQEVVSNVKMLPLHNHVPGTDAPLSHESNLDTPYLDVVHNTLLQGKTADENPEANATFQQFRALYHQTMLGISMRQLLPHGLLGLFCVLMILAMLSTDDGRIFSSSLTITQDIIMPFLKKQLTPKQHLALVRWVAVGVGVIFFCGSVFMSQVDYILMFLTIMGLVWTGGASPMMIFGLYSRFGTTAGAFASLISGLGLSLGCIFAQFHWADVIYPWLVKMNWVDSVGRVLDVISRPLQPYVVWTMNPVKCPINSIEFQAIILLLTLIIYVVVSKLTCKEPFNLDRMLHRGIYNLDGENKTRESWSFQSVFRKLLGITPEYSKGDRALAWIFFLYSFVYRILIVFLLTLIVNMIWPWPKWYWCYYTLFVSLLVPCFLAIIGTFWLGIGGIVNLFQLFQELKKRKVNDLDNGMVSGNVSLADKQALEEAEKQAKTAQK